MSKRLRWLICLTILGCAITPERLHAQNPGAARFAMGSFAKSAGAAPVSETIPHGLGVTPKAIIFWSSSRVTSGSFGTENVFTYGMTDGTTSRSAALASDDTNPSNASRRISTAAISFVLWGESTWAEASFVSWDATNFTINWTVNNGQSPIVHFMAIGGDEVSAKVVSWQAPTAGTGTPVAFGNHTVAGIGFRPEVVMHAYAGSVVTAAPPTSSTSAHFGLGVMDGGGAQWSNMVRSIDALATSEANRGQQTDAAIYMFGAQASCPATCVIKKASFVSMNQDGFTVNFTSTDTAASQIFSLALRGVSARAGSFNKSTAAGTQTVSGVDFRPGAVLFSSVQDVAQGATPVAHARFGFGASNGTTEASVAFQDANGVSPASPFRVFKSDKAFLKVDNNTQTINAEADLTGFFDGGFTLDWTTNDAVATQIAYLALAPASEAKILSGSYVGDGVDNRGIDVGFVPDFVMVKSEAAAQGVFRTSTMGADVSKEAAAATAATANYIQTFDATNGGRFIVGNDARVNTAAQMYRWVAFKAGPGKMVVGTYTGDGNPTQAVSGLGFSPDLVFVMSQGAHIAVHRSSAGPHTHDFEFSASLTNCIQTLDSDGFTVGNDARVNNSGTVYHYVAFNEAPDYMNVGSYTGNGVDNTDLTTLGFSPEYLIIKRHDVVAPGSGSDAVHRTASLDQGVDSSLYFRAVANGTLRIKALLANGFRRGTTGNVNLNATNYVYYAWKRGSQPMVVTGMYNPGGVGAAQTIQDLSFTPDAVIVKQLTGTSRIGVMRVNVAGMTDGKQLTGATALTAQTITGLAAANGGFTVGTSALVSSANTDYHFIAFKAAPGTMKVGTYTGQGATPTTIAGLGFSPELVFILPAAAAAPVHFSTASTLAFDFANNAGTAGLVAFGTDSFTVSTTNASVNAAGAVYYYAAWNEIPGHMDVGTYNGNSTGAGNNDNRSITGVGFEPEYVVVRRASQSTVHHTGSVGRSTDSTMYFSATGTSPNANLIQALIPDGFQVGDGTTALVNTNGQAYFYYAWSRPEVSAMTAVRLISFTATRYDKGVLLNWKTGYEIDNLGFHVYREIDGVRTRVTRSMIAGTGLMAGQGQAVEAEQRYATWDTDPASADPTAVYWLEDLDMSGASTQNGPVTPIDGGLHAPPAAPVSTELRELSNRWKRRGKLFNTRGAQLERVRRSDRRERPAAAAELQVQRGLAGQLAVKIGVDYTGWYRVTQTDLVSAGLDPRVDPNTIRLFADGAEQAITVAGARDGRFDPADYVEFYGTALDTPYTNTRVYWLTGGVRGGRRMVVHDAPMRSTRATGPSNFTFTLQQKERSIYFAALRNGDEENWFGAFISEEPSELVFEVANLDGTANTAELEIVLQGVSARADLDQDHRVAVFLNETELGDIVFDGQSKGSHTFAIPADALFEGTNYVTILSRGGEEDFSLVDVARLRYPHTYRADADLLRFTADGPGPVIVAGFSSPDIRVVDVTDPAAPEQLRGVVQPDAGLFAITTRIASHGARTLIAFTDATVASPASISANTASTWHAAGNRADYVVVTHAAFAPSLDPLLERRKASGLAVARVDIEDVYDEFSFGEKSPQALKDFVTHARATWGTVPRFLVLVGDATMDPRDYAGMGQADFVPTKQVPMAQVALETASDDWFADANDDGLAELAVGRLSVRSPLQADAMVAKILNYEDSDGFGWTSNVLLAAGVNDDAGNFEESTAALQRLVPSTYTVTRVLSGSGVESARAQLSDAITRGQLIVNYIGHGSVRVWGRESLLSAEDVNDTWQNADRLPLVIGMNCLNGFFHGIYDEESLAETLLRSPRGGAVAAWASSGVTETATQARVNQQLFKLLFGNTGLTIGEAAVAAKQVVGDRDLRRSWIFFGDPAMRLKIAKAESRESTANRPQSSVDSRSASDAGAAPTAVPAAPRVRLSDWNGDGRDDIFLHGAAGWRAIFSSATGDRVRDGQWTGPREVHPANLNGDRVQDMVVVDRESGVVRHGTHNGSGQFTFSDGLLGEGWQLHVANLNGDSLDDVVLTMPDFGFWYTLLNDGHGHFTARGGAWAAAPSITFGDFDGDRRTDAFLYNPQTGASTIAFSDGAGDFTYTAGTSASGWTVHRARVDADDRTDLLLYNPETGVWAEWASQYPGPDRRRLGEGGFNVRTGVWKGGLTVRAVEGKVEERDDVLLYDARSGEWTFVITGKKTNYVTGVWHPRMTVATGDLNGDGRTDLLLHDEATGAWIKGFRRDAGAFDFSSGHWEPGWLLALEP